MSFEAVWGFDPEEILKTQKALHNEEEKSPVTEIEPAPDEGVFDHEVEDMKMPLGLSAQIFELRRLFRE